MTQQGGGIWDPSLSPSMQRHTTRRDPGPLLGPSFQHGNMRRLFPLLVSFNPTQHGEGSPPPCRFLSTRCHEEGYSLLVSFFQHDATRRVIPSSSPLIQHNTRRDPPLLVTSFLRDATRRVHPSFSLHCRPSSLLPFNAATRGGCAPPRNFYLYYLY